MNDPRVIPSRRDIIGRRALPHDPPLSVADAAFFITICCHNRGTNHLCDANTRDILFAATPFYERQSTWFVHVLLLMPDHLHFVVRFARDKAMRSVVKQWKRFTCSNAHVKWQRDFFDHRLRRDESFREKVDYILNNPVRAGFVERWEDWPYVYFGDAQRD